QHLCDHFAGDVVTGGAEATSDENEIAAEKGIRQHDADVVAIGNRRLPPDAETEWEEFLPEVGHMGVDDFTEKQLVTRIDDFDAHTQKEGGGRTAPRRELRFGGWPGQKIERHAES